MQVEEDPCVDYQYEKLENELDEVIKDENNQNAEGSGWWKIPTYAGIGVGFAVLSYLGVRKINQRIQLAKRIK